MTATATERCAFFNQLAQKRKRDIRRHRFYYRDREKWLKRFIHPECSVVELGCSIAPTLRNLPNKERTGIDFSEEMIRIAKEEDPHGTYIVENVEHLLHTKPYDYVLLLDSINYIQDIEATLRNIHKNLCHERTRIIITHYNFLWQPLFALGTLFRWKTRFPALNWLSRKDVANLLNLTGFEVIQHGSRVMFPFNIPLLSWLCNRYLVQLPFFRAFGVVKYSIARPLRKERKEYAVTVLSAVRNERGNVAPIIRAMPFMGKSTEIMFVEGHSSDGTWEEIEKQRKEYSGPLKISALQQTGTGKGDALHAGIAASNGDILIIYDGDFTVHPSELAKLYEVLAEGRGEMLNGCRLTYPMQEGAMRFLNLMGNKVFSMLFSWLFSQHIVDSLSPVKAFFRRDYRRMTFRGDPFGDFDFWLGASMQQLKMREVPMHYLERTYGVTKMRPFRHAWMLIKLATSGAKQLKWI